MNPRRIVLSLLLCLAASSVVIAQKDDKKPTVFTTAVEYVQVPVVVQRDGKHVPGLKKEHFTLLQDGKEQPIASFEEVKVEPKSTTAQDFKNTDVPSQNIAIIAIDTINTPKLDQTYFRGEMEKYLDKAAPSGTIFGLVELTRNGVKVLHDFTDDPQQLKAAVLDKKLSQPLARSGRSDSVREAENVAVSRLNLATEETIAAETLRFSNINQMKETEDSLNNFRDTTASIDTLLVLQQLAQALKGLPGRKTLLLVGSGFQFINGVTVTTTGQLEFRPTRMGEAMDQNFYTWKLLNDANVAVYPIDTRRTVNTAFEVMDPSNKYSATDQQKEQARQRDNQIISTFQAIAAQTGGRACFFRTDLDNCVKEAIEDNAGYYLIGFYADKSNKKVGWHKISVKVTEKANVRHRQGFVIAELDANQMRQTDLQLALNSPFSYTALPFTGRIVEFTPGAGKKMAKFELRLPPDSVTVEEEQGKVNFDVVAIARATGGKEAARLAQRLEPKLTPQNVSVIKRDGIVYSNRLELASGEYGIWFVVRDNISGRTGSVVVPVKVP